MPRFRPVALASSLLALSLSLALPAGVQADWGGPLAFPIRTDAATRTLVGADGAKVTIVGDAAWSLLVQLSQAEVQQYLDDRRARGFNTVLVNLIEHKFADQAPANRYGQQPFLVAGDFSQPNDAYFDNAEWVVSQAELRGILVLLAPMYLGFTGSDEGWYNELVANGPVKARAYGAYVGRRFAAHRNVIWVHGGDQGPGAALDAVDAVVAGIKDFDTTNLHTAHPAPNSSSIDDYDRPWLGADAIYTPCGTTQAKTRAEWQRGRTMPIFHIEGYYEGEHTSTPACWLDQLYYTTLNGARGHVFGNNPIWFFGSGWPTALSSTGAQYVQHAAALFRSREGAELVPDVSGSIVAVNTGAFGNANYAAAAKAPSGRSVLVYLPVGGTIQIDTTQVPGPQFVAWWYNPRDGHSQNIGSFSTGGNAPFTAPDANQWVLVLDDPRIGSAPGSPGLANRYRIYSDITKEHHYTTDENEYTVLGTRGWVQEGIAHRVYRSTAPVNGITPVPLYRLYHSGIRQHLWTTDKNEYDTLATRNWGQEGIDGYILPAAVPGITVPLYRLSYKFLPIHLWTTDTNEYTVLAGRGWVQEGVAGHVAP